MLSRSALVLMLLLASFIAACTTTRYASYRPPHAVTNYGILVNKEPGFPPKFVLSINDQPISNMSWGLNTRYTNQVEGVFDGKPVIMRGTFSPRPLSPTTIIEVLIAGEKAAQFEFD